MFEKNDLITVVCLAGEITGKYVKSENGSITLKDPRILTQTEQGIGYAKGICMSGEISPQTATISQVMFVVKTNDEFASSYHRTVSGLVV